MHGWPVRDTASHICRPLDHIASHSFSRISWYLGQAGPTSRVIKRTRGTGRAPEASQAQEPAWRDLQGGSNARAASAMRRHGASLDGGGALVTWAVSLLIDRLSRTSSRETRTGPKGQGAWRRRRPESQRRREDSSDDDRALQRRRRELPLKRHSAMGAGKTRRGRRAAMLDVSDMEASLGLS